MGRLFVLAAIAVILTPVCVRPPGARADDAASNAGLLTPTTLAQALERAQTDNTTIRNAEQALRQKYGMVVEAQSQLLPRVDLGSSYFIQDRDLVPPFQGRMFGSNRSWDARAQLRQRVFSGGKALAGYRRQDFLRAVATEELAQTVEQVLLDVKERYFAVLLARAQAEVREKSVELLKQELHESQARLKAGTVSQFNVLRAEVALANARAPLIRAQNATRLAAHELERVLAIEPDQLSEGSAFDETLAYVPVALTLSEAQHMAKSFRPELRKLSLQLEAAAQGIAVERADFLPSLFAVGGYVVEKDRFSDNTADSLHGWTAGAEATWNIFDSFATHARVDQAQAAQEVARSNLRQSRVDIAVEVRRAYASLEEARQLVQASEKVVQQGEESLRLAKRRVDAGAGTQLEVLDAQLALTEARTNAVQALYDYTISVARLDRATASRLAVLAS